jgi:hypothetical protein
MRRYLNSNKALFASVTAMIVWGYVVVAQVRHVEFVSCPYKVSSRGVIHTPQSPYYDITADHRCVPSYFAAVQEAKRVR